MKILVRFTETERYDPLKDCEVVRFMATMDKGSFHAEIPIESPKTLRTNRQAFKDRVVELIQQGQTPCEVRL